MTGAPTTPPRRRGRPARTLKPDPDQGHRRVAIYVRRSTDDEHQPFSLDAQRAALTKYVTAQPNWVIVADFEDDASGATTNRPGLQNALRAAEAGQFDLLLVYRTDRLTRRLFDLLDLVAQLDNADVSFASSTEQFDTGTPIGRLFLHLLGMFAEFERSVIIDRVKHGMTTKASKGKWAGGSRPYGYLVDPDTHKLVPNPTEVPILRDIFRLYTHDRLGTRAIADELNRRGIPNRTGHPWAGYTINRILDNPAYVGDIAYRDVYVPDAHQPLIDRDTFARAQQIATARGDAQTQRAMSDSDYYLTGLLTCPHCGHKYIGTSANGRTRRYRYYTCFSRTRYGKAGCPAPRIPADEIDQAVLQALVTFYTTADHVLAAIIERARAQHRDTHADRRAELDAVTAQIKTTETAIDRYHTAFENGTMDDATAGPRIKELRARIEQLRARHTEITDQIDTPPAPPPPGTIERLRSYLHRVTTAGTPGERKAAIETLIADIKITDQGVIPVFRIPTQDTPLPPPTSDEGNNEAETPVRTMVRSVGRRGLEPRT